MPRQVTHSATFQNLNFSVHQFIIENNKAMVTSPYSPNLAPSDLFLDPKMKIFSYRNEDSRVSWRFKLHCRTVLGGIMEQQFQIPFQQQKRHWTQCTNPEGVSTNL
jgi:hypothetical protein